jgi:glycosyltransferase involved in cell wall biosynthesis
MQTPRISIITPCLNAAGTIRDALASVQLQGYCNYEHVVVDGGSTDATLDIANDFPNVVIHSGPDRGQSDAMNIGFSLASGDIIGYLNADDYYLPNAFNTAVNAWPAEASFVIGPVLILQEDGGCRINRGGTAFERILRHWEPDAFCVNPVGYFYRREVQDAVGGFNINNHFSMDLEFMLAAAHRFRLDALSTREPLGVFRQFQETKTIRRKNQLETWTEDYYPFLSEYARNLDARRFYVYQRQRRRAYAQRRAKVREAVYAQKAALASHPLSAAASRFTYALLHMYNQAAFLDVSLRTDRLRRERQVA